MAAGLLALLALPAGAAETPSNGGALLPLPSGMQALLAEIIWDGDAQIGRFRFIAPALPDHADDAEAIDADMLALCREFARPIQRGLQPDWEAIVIAIADAPIPFAEYDPEVLQLFGGFVIEGAECQWDDF